MFIIITVIITFLILFCSCIRNFLKIVAQSSGLLSQWLTPVILTLASYPRIVLGPDVNDDGPPHSHRHQSHGHRDSSSCSSEAKQTGRRKSRGMSSGCAAEVAEVVDAPVTLARVSFNAGYEKLNWLDTILHTELSSSPDDGKRLPLR